VTGRERRSKTDNERGGNGGATLRCDGKRSDVDHERGGNGGSTLRCDGRKKVSLLSSLSHLFILFSSSHILSL